MDRAHVEQLGGLGCGGNVPDGQEDQPSLKRPLEATTSNVSDETVADAGAHLGLVSKDPNAKRARTAAPACEQPQQEQPPAAVPEPAAENVPPPPPAAVVPKLGLGSLLVAARLAEAGGVDGGECSPLLPSTRATLQATTASVVAAASRAAEAAIAPGSASALAEPAGVAAQPPAAAPAAAAAAPRALQLPSWLCERSAGLEASHAICRATLLSTTAALARLSSPRCATAALGCGALQQAGALHAGCVPSTVADITAPCLPVADGAGGGMPPPPAAGAGHGHRMVASPPFSTPGDGAALAPATAPACQPQLPELLLCALPDVDAGSCSSTPKAGGAAAAAMAAAAAQLVAALQPAADDARARPEPARRSSSTSGSSASPDGGEQSDEESDDADADDDDEGCDEDDGDASEAESEPESDDGEPAPVQAPAPAADAAVGLQLRPCCDVAVVVRIAPAAPKAAKQGSALPAAVPAAAVPPAAPAAAC